MADEDGGGLPHLADRLNELFARVPRPGTNQPYSNDRAAEELSSAGVSVTGAYLGQLRSGKKSNPSARLIAGIAELFEAFARSFFAQPRSLSRRWSSVTIWRFVPSVTLPCSKATR